MWLRTTYSTIKLWEQVVLIVDRHVWLSQRVNYSRHCYISAALGFEPRSLLAVAATFSRMPTQVTNIADLILFIARYRRARRLTGRASGNFRVQRVTMREFATSIHARCRTVYLTDRDSNPELSSK